MRKALILAAGILAASALPAFADGYRNAPPPNRGPAPLSPHDHGELRYHGDEAVRVVRIKREAAPVSHGNCGCCCAQTSSYVPSHSRTYTTEPVVIRHYTRTYTRQAAPAQPSCGHAAYSYSSQPAPQYHGHHGYQRYEDSYGEPAYKQRHYHERRYSDGDHHGGSYHDGRRDHDRWEDSKVRYERDYPRESFEGRILMPLAGEDDGSTISARRDAYSYYQARHK